jgi:predicted RNase H-like nuclease (RuvC/YqgF family)
MPDEEKTLEEQLAELRAEKEKLESEKDRLAREQEEANEKLKKYQDKDYNFKRLRDMTEEEKERLTEVERELKMRQEKLEDEQKEFRSKTLEEKRANVFKRFSNGDAELEGKLKNAYDLFSGDADTMEAIEARAMNAYKLVRPDNTPNPVMGAFGSVGTVPTKPKAKNFSETDEGKAYMEAFGVKPE